MVIDNLQFLASCWTEGLSSLLAVHQGHPQFFITRASLEDSSHYGSRLPWEQANERAKESKQHRGQSLFVTISEVTSHYFWHFLLFRSKLLDPAHTQGEEIIQRYKYQEMGFIEDHLGSKLLFPYPIPAPGPHKALEISSALQSLYSLVTTLIYTHPLQLMPKL